MERVFTTDIRNQRGDVKFRAGSKRDWPKATWDTICQGTGLALDEFTASPEAAAALVAELASGKKSAKQQAQAADLQARAPAPSKGKKARTGIRRA